MTTEILKEKIHSLVDASSEDVLESVYQLLQAPNYTTAFKNVLNEEFEAYQKDGEALTASQMDVLIKQILCTQK
ncbi:MAG: hypothetical protein QM541_11445 [Flavobacterium sp.]|nr:hypothetical protein [Flavobacterium sp.]